ncbi:hypothetical protein ERJ77_01850 [Vibrio anguillarum]|uniref:Uncharacterized protein n=1 Tax=Vibrio anguillarum TaxID=55601 RepID=A0AAW4B6H3_VIBAN|nr:hypothetical protein [Vibrio anguillarum]
MSDVRLLTLVDNALMEAIQYTDSNLLNVLAFTGKSKRFNEWFKSDADYVKYVKEHDGLFKIFRESGSFNTAKHGDWIVKESGKFFAVYPNALVMHKMKFVAEHDELATLRQQNAELIERLDILLSSYGDNWYDGFMMARKMVSKNTCPSDLSEQEVLVMSEIAEQEWIKSKLDSEI